MRKFHLLLILATGVLTIFFVGSFRSQPPVPEITVKEEAIPSTQGSYCWEGFLSARCVDFNYTSALDMAKKHHPTNVSPQEKIKIQFEEEPISDTLKIEQWINEHTRNTVEVNDHSIQLPEEKGVYVYHITVRWKQGDGNYAFSIEVQ